MIALETFAAPGSGDRASGNGRAVELIGIAPTALTDMTDGLSSSRVRNVSALIPATSIPVPSTTTGSALSVLPILSIEEFCVPMTRIVMIRKLEAAN